VALSPINRRLFLLQAGGAASLLAASPMAARAASSMPAAGLSDGLFASNTAAARGPVFEALDGFVPTYLKAMNGPGLTLGIVDTAGGGGSVCYGYANLDRLQAVTPDLLFQIGSISKSFLAIILLQLREEGKVNFNHSVLEYLPWLLIDTPYGEVTLHHMLTHSSGLPGDPPIFPSNPTDRALQAWKPGERFHYSNFCFTALGYLVEKLDKRPYHESIQQRILDPLGMAATSPVLSSLIQAQTSDSYTPEVLDRPSPRQTKLATAAKLEFDSAAGCIASTPDDMRKYMRMLLKRGQGEKHRILKEESFALFSHPHVKAEEFGPTASYGYGIAVDTLDGHTILRHTGGMVSFMSAMHVDLDGGFAAFASVNAQLGYRPNPVAQFAIQCQRAQSEGKVLPTAPVIDDPATLKNAKEYEGQYHASDGKRCRVVAHANSITLQLDGREIALEGLGSDRFASNLPEYSSFAFVFQREQKKPDASAETDSSAPLPITELTHGGRWFSKGAQSGGSQAVDLPLPERFLPFLGKYIGDSPWEGSIRIVGRKGRLWVDGEIPLIETGVGLFRLGDEPDSPETLAFFHVVENRAQMVKSSGSDFWRITTESE
jgi:D-alanyl-D-alanine carboxypeptidase